MLAQKWTRRHAVDISSLERWTIDVQRGTQEFHQRISEYIKVPMPTLKSKLESFLKLCSYISGQYDQTSDYQRLQQRISEIENTKYPQGPKNRLFYMALPPSVFTDVAKGLKETCYSNEGINRIVVEKPFGKDLESSREMMGKLKELWKEHEVD
jgi:glucose-6-phosphate 1-dehydrogenase